MTYQKALNMIQKGYDKKSKLCAESSIEFVKKLIIKTVQDRVRNSFQVIHSTYNFYNDNHFFLSKSMT